ncbi:hypothetical protein E3N88_13693 [Mikania micrantha]|uniref:Uncharacterized protein n=1 Tax=Mikania micrantha TaxID=192012 RepID=A0A5N6P1C8_9ASTR|nr:hypothetical protein E3N88_13693 [Mikania micrantha]
MSRELEDDVEDMDQNLRMRLKLLAVEMKEPPRSHHGGRQAGERSVSERRRCTRKELWSAVRSTVAVNILLLPKRSVSERRRCTRKELWSAVRSTVARQCGRRRS